MSFNQQPFGVIGDGKGRTHAVLSRLVDVASALFDESFAIENHCIDGTRVVVEALRKFKIDARPFAVGVNVYNKLWAERFLAGGPAGSEEVAAQWEAEGGYCAGIDVRPTTAGFAGHVIAVAKGWLIDSASGQFSRPEKDMMVPDVLAVEAEPGFLVGKTPQFQRFMNGTLVLYKPRFEDRTFIQAAGWARSPRNMSLAKELVARMRRDS